MLRLARRAARPAVETHTPDVVVTDIRMPPTGTDEGIRAAAELRATQPEVGVVVLSQYVSPQYAVSLLDQGSQGRAYLLKDRVADVDDLVDAIRVVAKGGSVIDPKVVDELVRARSRADRSPLEHLTPREREVLGEMASGKSNAAIAGQPHPLRAGRREAHQLDLLQAPPGRGGRRQPPRQGRPPLPRRLHLTPAAALGRSAGPAFWSADSASSRIG